MSCSKCLKSALAGLALLGAVFMVGAQISAPSAEQAAATITVAELPRQGVQTYQLIRRGGPFANQKDGVVFGNRERLLPVRTRGDYREYTVKTPGSRDRGGRRIVCGGQPRTPDACYYSDDHYTSFRRILP